MITDEEFSAITVIAKYHYYKQYVEPLEREYDELLEENEKLKKSEQRYRNLASKLQKDKQQLKNTIKKMKGTMK